MSRWMLLALALSLSLVCTSRAGSAQSFDYGLRPQAVTEGVFVFEGRREHFSRDNGGNIVNTGYILTDEGAVVIDTGPSKRYGQQMRAIIEASSGKPVSRVYLTHGHPDHFLGNQAYADRPIYALAGTRQTIRTLGDDLSANLYRLVGGWMEGTEANTPVQELKPGTVDVGGRTLRLISKLGHTDADLAVFDEKTRTLFAGDLVFFERTPTTPNADITMWLAALDELDRLEFAALVPGHGPVVRDHQAIEQTRAYLKWLRDSLRQAARRGLDLNEAMQLPVPERFRKLAVFDEEFQRSVVHLYPEMELETLDPATP